MESGTKQILYFICEEWKLLTLLTVLFAIYFYCTSTFDHFEKKGVKYIKPTILVGNIGNRILGKTSFHDFTLEVYNHFKGNPFGGIFEGRTPRLFILDPDLIKAVTTRDFDHFTDRISIPTKQPRYLSRNLLNLKGQEWKAVRSIMTPTFSSMRLKLMVPLINQCTDNLINFLKQFDQKDLEMKDVMGRYTLEVIGVSAFGIKYDPTSVEWTKFLEVAQKFDYMPLPKRLFLLFLLIFCPKLLRFIDISFLNCESCNKLTSILKMTKAERTALDHTKGDFLQIMVDAAAKEKEELEANSKSEIDLDDDTINGQLFIFLIAGYETTGSLLSFAIYTLATKPDLQIKLRAHIEEVTNGKDINYEILSKVDYLEAFLYEVLRIYPPVSRTDRQCTKPYTLPGTNVQLNVSDAISIPILGIHMDPDIYPDPKEFRPERFLGEEKNQRPSHLYLSFGTGPRVCIGPRFAMVSAKIAMIALMKNFKFSTCPKTDIPIQINKRAMLLKAQNGIWVKLEKI